MCSTAAAMIGLQAIQGINNDRAIRQQASAQAAAYNAQAKAAEQNSRIANNQRQQMADQYAERQRQLDDKKRLVIGQQLASAGASGLDSSGSVLDANAAVNEQYNRDSMNLLYNQRNDELSAYQDQVNYANEASGYRSAASNVKSQVKGQRLANFISTAAGIYGAYNQYKGAGTEQPKNTSTTSPWMQNMINNHAGMRLATGNPYIPNFKNKPFTFGWR